MKIDWFLDIRFLVPPILAALFFASLRPEFVKNFLEAHSQDAELLLGAGIILGFGFLISTITETIINAGGFRAPRYRNACYLMTLYSHWPTLRDKPLNVYAWELLTWHIGERVKKEVVFSQIHKRWHMAMANFNSITGIVAGAIAAAAIAYTHYDRLPAAPLLIGFTFAAILFFNGREAYRSVMEMDRLLAEDLEHTCTTQNAPAKHRDAGD